MRIRTILIYTMLTASLTNCASYDFSRRIVQQGNLLPESKIAQIKTGMSKETIRIIMGTSLLSPSFRDDRWDYAYTKRRANTATTIKHVSLYFNQDKLVKIEQDVRVKE